MLKKRLTWSTVPFRVQPWREPHAKRLRSRQDRFLQGIVLAVPAALVFLPAWIFLVHAPRFAHAHLIAVPVFGSLAVLLAIGTGKLVGCIDMHELDIISAMSAGALMILLVVAVYTAVLIFALLYPGFPPNYLF